MSALLKRKACLRSLTCRRKLISELECGRTGRQTICAASKPCLRGMHSGRSAAILPAAPTSDNKDYWRYVGILGGHSKDLCLEWGGERDYPLRRLQIPGRRRLRQSQRGSAIERVIIAGTPQPGDEARIRAVQIGDFGTLRCVLQMLPHA